MITTNHRLNTLHSNELKLPTLVSASPSATNFRQYLDDSDAQSHQQQNNGATQNRNNSESLKNSNQFDFLRRVPLCNTDMVMLTNTHQIPGLWPLPGLNYTCYSQYPRSFSVFTREEKIRRYMNYLTNHALNESPSSCATSQIIVESEDADHNKYILKVDHAGYSLTVNTQMQNFANELSVHAQAFEHFFSLKTGCKLEVNVCLFNRPVR